MDLLPHLLTISRILCSAGLLFQPLDSAVFWTLYLLCGLSDVLDGWLARRLHTESAFGARLDSGADLSFALALLIRSWPLLRGHWLLWGWCGAICLLRLAAAVTVRHRFGLWGVFYTLSGKCTGALLFLILPPFIWRAEIRYLFLPALAALFSAVEELWLAAAVSAWTPDCPGLFTVYTGRRAHTPDQSVPPGRRQ